MNLYKSLMILIIFAGGLWWSSCTKMDDYKNLIEGGEIVYPGKVDSVIVHPGKNRTMLSIIMGSDPSVTKVKAYWRNRSDSAEIQVSRTAGIDTVDMLISDLEEGIYNFELYTFDDKGNVSVPSHISGEVFGETYENSLLDRPLSSAACGKIRWGEASDEMLGVHVVYSNISGDSKEIFVNNNEAVTIIEDIENGGSFEYRTMYKPDSLAIDTFFTRLKYVVFENTILTNGTYEVLSENNTNHGWMPKKGQTREVTWLDEDTFSFILSTAARDAVPITVVINPETNTPSVELQEIGNFGAPWFMTAETVESIDNFVEPCNGIISLYLHIDNLDKNDNWGYFNVILQKK